MAEKLFYLRFYHKGEFQKTKYSSGTCTKIPTHVDADMFSYSALMEYVKDDVGYTEIGGVYVKKGEGSGWKILSNDADLCGLVEGLKKGSFLDLYIDTVVDKAIEPAKQVQPHVIIRPRTSYFEGQDFQLKRKFVTIQNLQKQQREKKNASEKEKNNASEQEKKKASEKEKKNASEDEQEDVSAPKQKKKVEKVKAAIRPRTRPRTQFEPNEAPKLTKYEEERLKRLAYNQERLQTAGFKNCLANKAIFDAKLYDCEKIADQESGCSDYEPESGDENDNDEEQIVTQNGSNRGKKSGKNRIMARKTSIVFNKLTETWKDMDILAIERVWKDIEDNTNLPPQSKRVCIDSMSRSWRDWKGRVKKAGYYAYDTDEKRLENRPEGVVAEQWSQLIAKWNLKESKKVAKTNKENAQKQDFWQSTGKKPIPVLKQQLADEGKLTDRLTVYMASRAESKREATKQMLVKLNEVIADMPEELQNDPAAREERFVDIFGKDQHGRMRCMGRSVTPTMIYGRRGAATSVESVTNVRAEFEEKMELQKQEMERRMQAEREAYKIEMEAHIQAEREANKIEMEAFKKEILSQLQSQH